MDHGRATSLGSEVTSFLATRLGAMIYRWMRAFNGKNRTEGTFPNKFPRTFGAEFDNLDLS